MDLVMVALSVRDHMMLDLERQRFKFPGAKEQDIRHLFDMSATRYYQALGILLEKPAALAHDPMTVKRLLRLRTARHTQRAAG